MSHLGLSMNGGIPDLHLQADGNLAVVRDADAISQHISQRLKTHKNEWFLDQFAGVPWIPEILSQAADPALLETVLKAEVMATHGVTEISEFSIKYNRERRELTSHSISVSTVYDEVK